MLLQVMDALERRHNTIRRKCVQGRMQHNPYECCHINYETIYQTGEMDKLASLLL